MKAQGTKRISSFWRQQIEETDIHISCNLAQRGMLVKPDLVHKQYKDYYVEVNVGVNEA